MTEIIGLLAETYIHPGSGQSAGAIDLPVARERTTDYPFIPGSSMKGALLDAARGNGVDLERVFGKQENAGQLLVSDARLLLLPVRSLSAPYRWIACPYVLERLVRDLDRSGRQREVLLPSVKDEQALAADQGELFLEERLFRIIGEAPGEIVEVLERLIPNESARKRLRDQLVVISNNAFTWFARNGLPVQARNVLHKEKKTSKNLWYEEALPPDTLMYLLLGERPATKSAATELAGLLTGKRYLQVGGNETVGQGWFAVKRFDGEAS